MAFDFSVGPFRLRHKAAMRPPKHHFQQIKKAKKAVKIMVLKGQEAHPQTAKRTTH